MRVVTAMLVLALPVSLVAQDLEPLAYAAAPVGLRFVVAGYSYWSGEVVTEPNAAVSEINAKLHAILLGTGGTFGLWGRTASLAVAAPYGWGIVTGRVSDQPGQVTRSGLLDARIRVAVNLMGSPALALRDFARRPPSTTIGVSLTTSVPTGQYSGDKLINLGTNRWAFRPEVGVSHPMGSWTVEAAAGTWLFTRNGSFYGGTVKTQDPMMTLQAHLAYTIRPRTWVALDATFYSGGRISFDGVPEPSRTENTRAGVTVSLPLPNATSVKLAFYTGAITRLAGDFDILSITLQKNFFR